MGRGLETVAALESLRAAWADVLAADREDGVLGAAVRRFAGDVEERIAALSEELLDRRYVPGPLTRVEILKEDGSPRVLLLPPVRDRVVERSALAVLTPVVDPELGPWCFAYRPGLGVADAVQAVARLRAEGLGWVARTDIADCFPSLPTGLQRRRLEVLLDDEGLHWLVDLLLDRQFTGDGGRRPVNGVPQGSSLSPLWANLVLTQVDDRLAGAGFPAVRYADDLAILAGSETEAREGMRVAQEAVGELGMRLGGNKSEVMSFEDGFAFLGEDFGPRYPPVLEDFRAVDPPRKVV